MITDRFRKIALASILAFTLATADTEAAAKDKPKEIDAAIFLAPFNNSLNIEAGSIEARFCLNYSFDENLRPESSRCTPFTFLRIYNKDGSLLSEKDETDPFLFTAQQNRGAHHIGFGTQYYYMKKNTPPPNDKRFGVGIGGDKEKGPWLLENEWHSIAVTWKVEKDGLHAEIFLDGKSQSSRIFPIKESNVRPFSKDDLLGIGGLSLSPVTILSYRISNRVRTNDEIASKNPLKPDDATTFFLDGESAAKCGKYDAKEFGKMNKKGQIDTGKTGAFFGKFKIVTTPDGKAIQFFDKLSR